MCFIFQFFVSYSTRTFTFFFFCTRSGYTLSKSKNCKSQPYNVWFYFSCLCLVLKALKVFLQYIYTQMDLPHVWLLSCSTISLPSNGFTPGKCELISHVGSCLCSKQSSFHKTGIAMAFLLCELFHEIVFVPSLQNILDSTGTCAGGLSLSFFVDKNLI